MPPKKSGIFHMPEASEPTPVSLSTESLDLTTGSAPPDLTAASIGTTDQNVVNQFVHIMSIISPEFMDQLEDALKDGGLKNSRKYRLAYLEKFWQKKNRVQKIASLIVIMFTSVVRTTDRLNSMARCIPDTTLRAAVVAVLGQLVKYNSMKTGANVLKLSGHNIASAFPDIITVTRMMMYGVQNMAFNIDGAAHARITSGNITGIATHGVEGPVKNLELPRSGVLSVQIRAYLAHLGAGQLDLDVAVLKRIKQYCVVMWENVVLKKDLSGPAGFGDEWYNRTQARDNYTLPGLFGVPTLPDAANLEELDNYATAILNVVKTSTATSAESWGAFSPQ